MWGRKIKTVIPSGEKINLDGAEIWMVRWLSYYNPYSGIIGSAHKSAAKAFFNKDDAKKFKQELIDANELLNNTTTLDITIEREQ